ncbi:MAG: YibE/F family protein [Gaiellaceae bacterium]
MLAALRRSLVLQLSVLALGVALAATVIGLVTLWPDDTREIDPIAEGARSTEHATVEAVARVECRVPGALECSRVTVRVRSGPDAGETASFTIGETRADVRLTVGDRVRVYRLEVPEGAQVFGREVDRYGFSDYDRGRPLALLALAFCAVVVAAGRWRGLRALVGLSLSLLIIVAFVVPAILDGRPPVEVALVGALAVMFVTIPLAHGIGAKGVAAMLGTAASLVLTALLASLAVDAVRLTGFASEETIYLRAISGDLSLEGLLLAGMIIGALGVLDDLTVSQSSTVMALRKANPGLGTGPLIRSALDVGHDHVAATVNTLVLAYVGASLPVLLVFSVGGTSFGDAVNTEVVAVEVVAMIVGSIGLIAALPITTALAGLIASRLTPEALEGGGHSHVHV